MTISSTGQNIDAPTRRASRGPSMADVAREAGVSSQTVSRVSNGQNNVDAATRDRVIAAMQLLGYRPNSAARALKTGRFRSIGVIMFTLSTFGNMRTLDAIATASAQAGYSITLIPVALPTQGEVAGAFSRLSEQAVDGIVIIIEAHILDRADITLPDGMPVVIVDSDAGSRYTVVDADQAQGARLATEHLLKLGHRSVWHIAGPRSSFSAIRRTESWRTTLNDAGAPTPEILYGDWSAESGYQHGLTLGAQPDVTAIFAANDQMALGVMRALHELGRPVPRSVSVVGFDDTEESSSFWPPLTTVHQDFSEVGRLCITALLHEIETTAHETGTTIVPTRLVVRESTAPPASVR
ncbi:LacI family DNA-binding transcriptional regulator [Glaciibacter superstes]|uniref:LacI family DNA-binding transcriptional regulator n=1 Tax=Glaciibacter superstes TaxID=501023 RepID=UPI0003B38C3A|nr:LacI family DNA-binding transcriptional regulator [Glaciibacter superstes]